MNELALERQLADQLADALINGGMDRQFQAIAFHEHTRNGFMYPGVKVGDSPESKTETSQAWQAFTEPSKHPLQVGATRSSRTKTSGFNSSSNNINPNQS
jgi:hypothetical protein